ncbi:uncharacterized protein LOC130675118 [Microplitis mediator]|uniref:uncharacterized protein LOC130675118 n=1 Tax=Microplitis mediator TaxID=375433 RepID=UPI002557C308|nr:uncharacterized protein LOC130675118 [Microplitis mediator]
MALGPLPYYTAIQQVKGSTPGEKFHTLNSIAREIIKSENQNKAMQLTVDSSELPEALKPLVQVEVARLSEQFEGICEALKSDDSAVFVRALRAKWFFNGSHENYRVQYYKERILPFVSLQSRHKIIKALAKNLTANPAIAEEFYTALTLMYEEKQAHLLLMACSESFIWNRITEHKLRLNNRMVRILFDKHPKLVVEYLKLSKKCDDKFERNLRPVNLQSHASFLPRLLKEYPDTFMELIELHHNNFNIKLTRPSTDFFFEKFPDALMRNPRLFLPMLNLKVVHENVTDLQFKAMFKQQFPPDKDSFEFNKLLQYLKCLPKDDKLPLMISTFEEVYGVKLLDCYTKITTSTLRMLPREDRIELVEEMLEYNNKRRAKRSGVPWICFLPCDKSIRRLKLEFKHENDSNNRIKILRELIYTCQVNADSDSFLKVINYIEAKHINEPEPVLIGIFRYISTMYPLKTLTRRDWNALIKLFDSTKNKFENWYDKMPLNLIVAAVRYDLDNNINKNTRSMKLLTEFYLNLRAAKWLVFTDNFPYNRICLEHSITNLMDYDLPIADNVMTTGIKYLLATIHDFNNAVTEAKSDVKVILIKDHPKLVKKVRSLLSDHIRDDINMKNLKVAVRNLDQDLYNACVSECVRKTEKLPKTVIPVNLKSKSTWKMLKTDPQYFEYNWEPFLNACLAGIFVPGVTKKSLLMLDSLARRFFRLSRWCQDLPGKIDGRLLENLDRRMCERNLVALAILFGGPLIEPFLASLKVSDITRAPLENHATPVRKKTKWVSRALSVSNPPVSLDLILKFCVNDCVESGINCLLNVSQQTGVDKVMSFANKLINQPEDIRKLRIRLLYMVEDAENLHITLTDLWTHETDQKVRKLLFRNVLKLFKAFPEDKNWELIKKCLDGLRPDDKYTFGSLMKFDYIPNEFIVEYVRKLFGLFRRLGDEGNDSQRDVVWFFITKLLNIDKNILVLFSDELHNEIIDNYVLDLSLPKKVQSAGHSYLINYIVTARDKLEDRLNRFKNIFVKIVKGNLDVPHPTEPSFYPANYFVHELIDNIIYSSLNNRTKRKLANTATRAAVDSDLKTYQDPKFFLLYTFTCIVNKVSPNELATAINRLLPKYAKSLGKKYIVIIAKHLYKCIDSFIGDRRYQMNVVDGLRGFGNDEAERLADRLMTLNYFFKIRS